MKTIDCVVFVALGFAVPLVSIASAANQEPQAGEEQDDNGLNMRLVWCPPGRYTMGSPAAELGHNDYENQVEVTLTRGFWIGKYEVTQGQWRTVMGTTPWKGRKYEQDGPKFPATYVNWNDAADFCQKFSETERAAGRLSKSGVYRLPDEQQWEYACRAGTTTAFCCGDDPSLLENYARYGGILGQGNAVDEPYAHQVGRKRANAWGIHDMHGNVSEWCQNWFLPRNRSHSENDAYARSGVAIVSAPAGVLDKAVRGGSWTIYPIRCRSANRNGKEPIFSEWGLGFRVICVEVGR